ncbi:MAG: hypothetical protein IJD16_01510 [Desulfovibrio sp.]|nr:hypothetical protein [Desulfovibrio sp.]
MSVRIAVSLRGQMRALASQGIFATDCHSQLQSILLQKLGPEHAALLAEPQHDAGGQSVDWYAQGSSQARCLKDLPEEEARALQARAGALARDIQNLARGLPAQDISGHLLLQALQHPSADDLWEVDGKAVLINWGFAPGAVGAQPQDLTRLGAAVPPPPPPPVPAAAPASGGCLPWLLPLLLLALLLWLLLAALGIAPSPFPPSCFRVDTAALAEEKSRAEHLDEEMAALWRQLQERAALCRPPAPAPKPEEKLPDPPAPEVVEPFLGETPPEPEKPVEKPKPKAKAEKPVEKPRPRKNEDLAIPDDAAKKNDLAFLEGCWTSETGLFSHPSREPITAEYCFDKNGRGRRFVRERNGQVCSGPARAGFNGNRLQFNADPARCPRGGTYVPQKVDCTGKENSTQCKGNELGGSGNKWDARFKRK